MATFWYTPSCNIFVTLGPYLILVTSKKLVGSIDGHSVYEVSGTELIPFSKTTIHLSESQVNHKIYFVIINPWCACAARVTVLGLCVSLSVCVVCLHLFLKLQAMRQLMSAINDYSATRTRKIMWRILLKVPLSSIVV